MRIARKFGFFLKDRLEGREISSSIKEIEEILQNPFEAGASGIRNERLEELMLHAFRTVPFYERLKGISFKDLPVVSKKVIQDHFEAFKSSEFIDQPLFKVATSGSTGVPFILYHNKSKRKRNTADVLYFMSQTGYEIGNTLFELEVWRAHNQRSWIKNFLPNTIQFDITRLSDQRITEFLDLVSKSKGPKNMLGFASAFESICQYMERNQIFMRNSQLKGITANSEYLNDYTKNMLKDRFGAPVFSRYSNEEIGILAHQVQGSEDIFRLNWASYIFEILNFEEDTPADKGQLGRIVVTDLFNYAMPLIRYDTGDIGMFHPDFPDHRCLKSVEGRKMDMVFDTKGNMLSSYVVYTIFYPYYRLLDQYQFIQNSKREYHIKLNLKSTGESVPEEALIQAVKMNFGADAKVTIEVVDEVPALSSGKRRKVVNLYRVD